MIPDPELLRTKEQEGQALLGMRPIDRDVYVAWSDSTRDVVGESFGGNSGLVRELISARRRISVTFETDPSYYLTQLAANLRRELAVVRKCIGQAGEGTASAAPAARSAVPAARAPARESLPASKSLPAREARPPRKSRILLVTGASRKVNEAVLSSLESERVVCVSLPADAGKLADEAGGSSAGGSSAAGSSAGRAPADDFAIVVVTGSKRDGASNRDLGFAVGFLTGLLGPERVCILHPEGVEPAFEESGVENISLQDPDGWRTKVLARLRRG